MYMYNMYSYIIGLWLKAKMNQTSDQKHPDISLHQVNKAIISCHG